MWRHGGMLVLAGLVVAALPQTVAAQKLEAGTWTGTIAPPGNTPSPATFEVRVRGDTTSITIKTQFGDLPFTDIKVLADRLTFTFTPGTPVNCVLMLRPDKSYAGNCTDGDGENGQLVMIPPAKSGHLFPGSMRRSR
ncbi:MAG: hypothetical protein ACRENP_11785 [Longimicrobiales bacterium]